MPEINQLFFNHKEVVELLIKKAGIHDGKWMLSLNFGFSPGNFGPTPDQMSPGSIVVVTKIGLVRAVPESPVEALVDAAVVNPMPSKKKP